MKLSLSSWKSVEEYLARANGIVIPLGSTEQHGPGGLIGTDALCASAVAEGLGERAGALVAPPIVFGVAQFNLAFPGTMSVRASTLMALIEDVVLSLAGQGFARFYFVNGHGGNIAPARAAFQDLYARWSLGERSGPAPRCRLRSWWEYPAADRLRQQLYGRAEGLHVTPSEVAITLHAHPHAGHGAHGAARAPLTPEFLRDHGGDNHWDARTHRSAFPDGRVGSDASLATAQHGSALLEAAIADACADYAAFLAEPGDSAK